MVVMLTVEKVGVTDRVAGADLVGSTVAVTDREGDRDGVGDRVTAMRGVVGWLRVWTRAP